MLNNLINRAICKIFNSYDSDSVNNVKHFMNVCDIRTLYENRRLAFLHKISVLDNIVLQTVLMCSSPRFLKCISPIISRLELIMYFTLMTFLKVYFTYYFTSRADNLFHVDDIFKEYFTYYFTSREDNVFHVDDIFKSVFHLLFHVSS